MKKRIQCHVCKGSGKVVTQVTLPEMSSTAVFSREVGCSCCKGEGRLMEVTETWLERMDGSKAE